jgi:peptidoglycan/LPS O-acetylase OafA/YrhL
LHAQAVDNIRYRPEIDGLRAAAVLGVVAYHFQPELLPGGFVGVDVFFVISGYLICRNILSAVGDGRFSLKDFYSGRIRRLYPSYLTVMLASTAVAWLLLSPEKMQYYATSLISSLLYFSNINFWLEAGYFDINSSLKPLLHTWSLSAEEQFYLFFPVTVLLAVRLRLPLLHVFLALLLLSFAANCLLLEHYPSAVFYLLPFRGWELLSGALLALGVYPGARYTQLHRVALLVGMALVILSFALIDHTMPFPGYLAAFPVVGTALVIGSSQHVRSAWSLRLLRAAPVVRVGLMSYALYLWHWPVVVFYRIYRDKPALDAVETACLFALCLALAWVSTFVIEPPFRHKQTPVRRVLGLAGGLSFVMLCFGVHLVLSGGAGYRYPQENLFRHSFVIWNELNRREKPQDCRALLGLEINPEYCQQYGGNDKVDFVIWGDSHAQELASFLATSFDNSFMVISAPGCPPLLGVHRIRGAPHADYCTPGNLQAIEERIKAMSPGLIVLISRWSLYHQVGGQTGGTERSSYYLCDEDCDRAADAATSFAVFKRGFEETLPALTSISRVLIFKSVPELSREGREIVLLPQVERANYIPSRAQHDSYQSDSNRTIDYLQEKLGYLVFDPSQPLCGEGQCKIDDGNTLYYFDDNHLNALGWQTLTGAVTEAFARAGVALTARRADR